MKIFKLFIALVAVFFLNACNGGIGVKDDFASANFKVGTSTKKDVLDYLGLPQNVMKDSMGRDHFLYESGSRLVGLCVGCGNVNSGVGLVPSMMSEAAISNGAEYIFDSNDTLLAKYESDSK